MGNAEKVPQLAQVCGGELKDQDSDSREAARLEAAALVEDFVAERGIGTLDSILNLAKTGDAASARKATRLAGEIPRDTNLLHEEVKRFLNT